MKRKIAFILSIIMLCAAMLPVQVFAEKDKVLENIVGQVKQMFNPPSTYTFSTEVYTENGKKVYGLNWSSKDIVEGSINVRVDEKGTILGYDNWKSYDYSTRKLPKFSRQDAKEKAEAFIKKVNPGVLSQIEIMENDNDYLMDSFYYFNFVRQVNGIPFYNNTISITVNRETGEVQSYYYNWSDDIVFTDASKAMNLDAAKKAYIEKMGLKLIYKYNYEKEKMTLYAVYTPKYGSGYAIDALTGEKVQLDSVFADGYGGSGAMATAKMTEAAADIALTQEELKTIEDVSNMISQEEADKIAHAFDILKLTDDFKLIGANLSRNWPLRNEYVWNLNYSTEKSKMDGSDYRYVNVIINAKTKEITSFSRNVNSSEGSKAKYTEAQAKQAAEDFLKSFKADRFKEVEFDDSGAFYQPYRISSEEQRYFSFNYSRKVNGATFPDNMLSVGFDAVSGEIINFNMNWFNVEFPAIDKVLDINKVYENLFTEIGLELQYKAEYPQDYYLKGIMPQGSKLAVKLIYALKPGKPQFFDANTGAILGYDGKPYKENKPVVYTDIKGHGAEKQINVLSEFGVSLEGPNFRPDESITQLDFFTLLSKTLNYYYGSAITANSSKDDIDNLYKVLVREGVVKEGEKNPTAAVTKEEAAKFMVRAMKYDKVADIRSIFNCSFKDKDQINPSLIGYVAIAQGLKIFNGNNGKFNPKAKLSRAQAAIVIYNYLQG